MNKQADLFRPLPSERHGPIKYWDEATGQSWAGRGMMPKWLVAELERGRTLNDFDWKAVK